MTGNEARSTFLDYFDKHNHRVVRSSSLVPHDDPTLLFTNAGMVQFKRIFIGEEKRDYSTAVTSQKCVRAGGKHNDLENVGYTARHHTFFEMLGNFSFGDYFKEKAIDFSWDLLVNGYGLPEDKLWVSIYHDDDEAFELWNKNIGVPPDKIVRLGEKDNFWAMGDTGPCGPCSEIHIDRGTAFGCDRPDCRVGCDCDRYLEIWNLVFMQFNKDASGNMSPLPKPSIDTGLGLERIISILQDAPTNYETDLFLPLIKTVEDLSGKTLGESKASDVAMKVIADHSRATSFLIGDGVLPSNEGRGYVLRRIMRRAIRYGRTIGLTRPFLHRTAESVFHIMEDAYPELKESGAFITNVIENEEKRFIETLDNGLKLLEDTLSDIQARGESTVPGDVIFKLYDTFGFPVDIVRDIVRDKAMSLDMETFTQKMDEQKARSKSVVSFSGISEAYKHLSAEGVKTDFSGYHDLEMESDVLLIVNDTSEVNEAVKGDAIEIVTAGTPFYAESGGQVGDTGKITGSDLDITISDAVKDPTGIIIHKGTVRSGSVKKGDRVRLIVDGDSRKKTALNHTATHLLHAALRSTLGDHVKQAGSLVTPERLRFDFSHFSSIDPQILDTIEQAVNDRIRRNTPVSADEMDMDDAIRTGATALFDEKYGDQVRVVSIDDYSREFCGGTHTNRTGDIGFFKILSESSIAAGVRRIEAITGESAVQHAQKTVEILDSAAMQFKDKPDALPDRIDKLKSDNKRLEKEIEQLNTKMAMMSTDDRDDDVAQINGINVISKKVTIDKPAALRDLADKFKDRVKSGVVVLGAVSGKKALLIVVVTKDLTHRFHAGNIVKQLAAEVGGGGGGRPDMAQAGGTKPENLDNALKKVGDILSQAS